MTTIIRVAIADDHDAFREGLKTALLSYEEFEVVADVRNGLDAVAACETLAPDLILMDIMMPQMDGLVACYLIHERVPATKIVMLTAFPEKVLVWATIQAGASGYLLKGLSVKELAKAIRNVYNGKLILSPEIAQSLIETVRPPVSAYNLTPREKEVLGYVVKGMTNDQIAAAMVVSPATAKKHVSNILAKLNVDNRAEAVAVALHHKLVDAV